jgi:hypothetical protein
VVSWLLLTLAAALYYETHPGHRYRKVYLLRSVIAAITIGVIEQSSVDPIILTNLPWCLALSTLVDTLLWGAYGVANRHQTRERPMSAKGRNSAIEKIDPA